MGKAEMKKLYYKVCVSAIYTFKTNIFFNDICEFMGNFFMSLSMANNLLFVFVILNNHLFVNKLDLFLLEWVNVSKFDFLINYTIYFVIPCMIFNYVWVFKGRKYKQLVKENMEAYNKKRFAIYLGGSYGLVLLYALFGKMIPVL